MNKEIIIKIIGTDKCPTCQRDLLFDEEIKNSLAPNLKNRKVVISSPYIHVKSKADVVFCKAPVKPPSENYNKFLEQLKANPALISTSTILNNLYERERDPDSGLEHFRATLYSERDYDIVRKVAHNKNVFGTRISVKDDEMIYSCFSKDGQILAKREKSYVIADNITLIEKIHALMMLK